MAADAAANMKLFPAGDANKGTLGKLLVVVVVDVVADLTGHSSLCNAWLNSGHMSRVSFWVLLAVLPTLSS